MVRLLFSFSMILCGPKLQETMITLLSELLLGDLAIVIYTKENAI